MGVEVGAAPAANGEMQAAIARVMERRILADYRKDAQFPEKFIYLISDMNTHVMHSLRFLRTILIECRLHRERQAPCATLPPTGRKKSQQSWKC